MSEPYQIRQEAEVITVFWVTYVHGVGVGMRAIGIPTTSLKSWTEFLENEGGLPQCEHQSGSIWVFQGIWPNELGRVFTHVSFDIHEVQKLLTKPGYIRVLGRAEAVTLLPVDPVTGACDASILDYNNWVEYHTGVSERRDFSVLRKNEVDATVADLEALLRSVADSNGKGNDNE